MSDIAKLVALNEQSIIENRELKQQNVALMQKMTELLANVRPPGAPAAPNAEDVRREKVSKLYINLKKSQKVKDYKEDSPENVREWLSKLTWNVKTLQK